MYDLINVKIVLYLFVFLFSILTLYLSYLNRRYKIEEETIWDVMQLCKKLHEEQRYKGNKEALNILCSFVSLAISKTKEMNVYSIVFFKRDIFREIDSEIDLKLSKLSKEDRRIALGFLFRLENLIIISLMKKSPVFSFLKMISRNRINTLVYRSNNKNPLFYIKDGKFE